MTTNATETTATTTPAETKKKPAPKARKKAAKKKVTRTKTTAKVISYTNKAPSGLFPVGTSVKYAGGARIKNSWLKKGAVGRVFGYRPGKTGGGLYAVRFEGGKTTLLSAQRVTKAAPKAGP